MSHKLLKIVRQIVLVIKTYRLKVCEADHFGKLFKIFNSNYIYMHFTHK